MLPRPNNTVQKKQEKKKEKSPAFPRPSGVELSDLIPDDISSAPDNQNHF
jgi:hypothetical protein